MWGMMPIVWEHPSTLFKIVQITIYSSRISFFEVSSWHLASKLESRTSYVGSDWYPCLSWISQTPNKAASNVRLMMVMIMMIMMMYILHGMEPNQLILVWNIMEPYQCAILRQSKNWPPDKRYLEGDFTMKHSGNLPSWSEDPWNPYNLQRTIHN